MPTSSHQLAEALVHMEHRRRARQYIAWLNRLSRRRQESNMLLRHANAAAESVLPAVA